MNIPTVVEQTHRGERSWDIFSRLLKDRIIFIGSEIDDDMTSIVIAELLVLESDIGQGCDDSHQLALGAVCVGMDL